MWMKALFSVLRYVSLGTQWVLFAWNMYFMPGYPISFLTCRNYHVFSTLSLLIQLASIDCLMILRVWLVFNRERKFFFVLMMAFICQVSIIIVQIVKAFSSLDMDGMCMAKISLEAFLLFWLASLIVHSISWAFTMYQCRRYRRQGRGRTPLISLLERDGTRLWLSFGLPVALGIILGYKVSATLAVIFEPWILGFLPALGCRMIINLQRLAHEETVAVTDDIELSSGVILTTNISLVLSSAG